MEKDRGRLIEGPGSVDENDHDEDEQEDQPYKANIRRNSKKHKLQENEDGDNNNNNNNGPQRKRRRITRSSKERELQEKKNMNKSNDEQVEKRRKKKIVDSNNDSEEEEEEDIELEEDEEEIDDEDDSDLDFEAEELDDDDSSSMSNSSTNKRRSSRNKSHSKTRKNKIKIKSRSPSTSISTKSTSPSIIHNKDKPMHKKRQPRMRNRKIKSKDIEATKLAKKLIKQFRAKQLIPVELPVINNHYIRDGQTGDQIGITSHRYDMIMAGGGIGNVGGCNDGNMIYYNNQYHQQSLSSSSYRKKSKNKKKKILNYERKYQSPFTVKMHGMIWFCSNFGFDTLQRGKKLNMECKLLATGDIVLKKSGYYDVSVSDDNNDKMKFINLYGLIIDRNVSVQINHEYGSFHWMSIHYNNGSRFMLGNVESIKVSEWHRNISESQYSLYPDHEFIDYNKLWNIGNPLQDILIGDIWTIHIPKIVNEKTMVVVNIKNPKIYPYKDNNDHDKDKMKISNMIWLQLISIDTFLSCTKNVILTQELQEKNGHKKEIYHKEINKIKEIYSFECTPQFLLKYGKKCDIDNKLWPDTQFIDLLKTDESDKFYSYSNYLILNDIFNYNIKSNKKLKDKKEKEEKKLNADDNNKDEENKTMTEIESIVLNKHKDYDDSHYQKWLTKLSDLKWRELTEVCRNLDLRVAGNTSTLKRRITEWARKVQNEEREGIKSIINKHENNKDKEQQDNKQQDQIKKGNGNQITKPEIISDKLEIDENEDNNDDVDNGEIEEKEDEPFYKIKSVIKQIGYVQKLNNLKLGSLILIKSKEWNYNEPIFIEGIVYEMHISGNKACIDCNIIITKLSPKFIKTSLCKVLNEKNKLKQDGSSLHFTLNLDKFRVDIFNNILNEYYNDNLANCNTTFGSKHNNNNNNNNNQHSYNTFGFGSNFTNPSSLNYGGGGITTHSFGIGSGIGGLFGGVGIGIEEEGIYNNNINAIYDHLNNGKSLPLSPKQKDLYKSIYDSFETYSLCKISIPNAIFIQ